MLIGPWLQVTNRGLTIALTANFVDLGNLVRARTTADVTSPILSSPVNSVLAFFLLIPACSGRRVRLAVRHPPERKPAPLLHRPDSRAGQSIHRPSTPVATPSDTPTPPCPQLLAVCVPRALAMVNARWPAEAAELCRLLKLVLRRAVGRRAELLAARFAVLDKLGESLAD